MGQVNLLIRSLLWKAGQASCPPVGDLLPAASLFVADFTAYSPLC